MRYCRFRENGQTLYGAVELRDGEPWIVDLAEAPEEDLAFRLEHGRSRALGFEPLPLKDVELLAPVTPSKIICVGRNYRDHASELGNEVPEEPILFFKPPSSLLASGGTVVMPKVAERIDYEGELGIVVGRRASKIHPGVHPGEDWRSYVRGYVLANDVTARDLQKKDKQWVRAKGFDTFCPVGPWVSDEIEPHLGVELETRVNGEVRQKGSTGEFLFSIPELLVYISAIVTLEPGDLILTGTPAGVAALKAGDVVEVAIDGLGVLSNPFAGE